MVTKIKNIIGKYFIKSNRLGRFINRGFNERNRRRVSAKQEKKFALLYDATDNIPLFHRIVIETNTWCNSLCNFCPANAKADRRGRHLMPIEIVDKMFTELAEIDFKGIIHLFNNNEPLLDKRILQFVELAHTKCPKAVIQLLTNGTLLDVDIHMELFNKGLNLLRINNYSNNGLMHKSVREFCQAYSKTKYFTSVETDVQVHMRRLNEILSNRCGLSPNKPTNRLQGKRIPCFAPCLSITINYKGDVLLCCYDVYYKFVIGNVIETGLLNLWNSRYYIEIRKNLMLGRRYMYESCKSCDAKFYYDSTSFYIRMEESDRRQIIFTQSLLNKKLLNRHLQGTKPVEDLLKNDF